MKLSVRNRNKRIAAIVSIVMLVGLVEAWSVAAPKRGRMAARYDLGRGHYKILAYGLAPGWRSEYDHLLKERYGIEVRTVALCLVSETLRSYVDSYDEVSAVAVNRKFGHDVFNECAEAARKNWEAKRASAPKE
jgi:hypothetical protein